MPVPANVGPEAIHRFVGGGASLLQMELMGGGHDPRCHHYEWGPCNCEALAQEAVDDARFAKQNPPPPLGPDDRLSDMLLCHVGSGCRPVGRATQRQVQAYHESVRGGSSGVFFVSPDGMDLMADIHGAEFACRLGMSCTA